MQRSLIALATALLVGEAAWAEPPADNGVVTSAGPVATSVAIYRGPNEMPDAAIDPGWLEGYALVTETREVDLPAGRSIVRFEGVAAGMLAESAIITGLPAGVREKNLDADLLSPGNLYSRAYGRPVILRRQDPVDGAVREQRAVIRSGPDGAAIVQTTRGFEAANCGNFQDGLDFVGLPEGLSARPTLSVETVSPVAGHARLTLSYLAWGFDWRAHYNLVLRPDGRRGDLTAWVTLASSDATAFPATEAAVVGGKPNFSERRDGNDGDGGTLELRCYLHPLPPPVVVASPLMTMAPMPAPPAPMIATIMVTAARAVTVKAEALGDLKLFRLPLPTTLGARAQKQVALLDHRALTLTPYYTGWIGGTGDSPVQRMLRTRNRAADGLGLALPAGRFSVAMTWRGHALPIGDDSMTDKAIGERIEIALEPSPLVHIRNEAKGGGKVAGQEWRAYRVHVTNANPWPIRFEGKLPPDPVWPVVSSSARLAAADGNRVWVATVPGHGEAALDYRLVRQH